MQVPPAQERLQQTFRSVSAHAIHQHFWCLTASPLHLLRRALFLERPRHSCPVRSVPNTAKAKACSSHHTTVLICCDSWLWIYSGKNRDQNVFLVMFLSFPGTPVLSSPRISFSMLFVKYSGFLEAWIMCFAWFQNILLLWCEGNSVWLKAWLASGWSHNLFSYNLFLIRSNVIITKPITNQLLERWKFALGSYFTSQTLDTLMKTALIASDSKRLCKERIHSFGCALASHRLTFEYLSSVSLYTKEITKASTVKKGAVPYSISVPQGSFKSYSHAFF